MMELSTEYRQQHLLDCVVAVRSVQCAADSVVNQYIHGHSEMASNVFK